MARRGKCKMVGSHNTKAIAKQHVEKIRKTSRTAKRAYYRKTRSKMLPYKIYACY